MPLDDQDDPKPHAPQDDAGAKPKSSGEGPGLPPVAPPSGRFIIQLFLVPGLIVAVIVCVLIGVESFLGRGRSPEDYLKDLNDENPHVRWRAAADLSQDLPNNPALASNVKFALVLAKRLEQSANNNDGLARNLVSNWTEATNRQRKDFNADREFVQFLISCQGHFFVPVGIPVLTTIATVDKVPDVAVDRKLSDSAARQPVDEFLAKIIQGRRHRAVLSLTVLGANVRRFQKLPQSRKDAILKELEAHQTVDGAELRAQIALTLLQQDKDHPYSKEVARALAKTAKGPDPYLRQLTAHALYFWDGPNAEAILEELTKDDGHGVEFLERNEDIGDRTVERYARQIRYQAVASLAGRGSAATEKYLAVLREMLNEKRQNEHARVKNKHGETVINTDLAQAPVLTALKAVTDLHAKQAALAKKLLPQVTELTGSSNSVISANARELQQRLQG